jgi:hypothetical protein
VQNVLKVTHILSTLLDEFSKSEVFHKVQVFFMRSFITAFQTLECIWVASRGVSTVNLNSVKFLGIEILEGLGDELGFAKK